MKISHLTVSLTSHQSSGCSTPELKSNIFTISVDISDLRFGKIERIKSIGSIIKISVLCISVCPTTCYISIFFVVDKKSDRFWNFLFCNTGLMLSAINCHVSFQWVWKLQWRHVVVRTSVCDCWRVGTWGLGNSCRVYSVLLRGSKNYQNKTFRNIAKFLHRGKDTVTDFYLFDCLFLLEYTSKATPLKATKSLQLCDSFSNL